MVKDWYRRDASSRNRITILLFSLFLFGNVPCPSHPVSKRGKCISCQAWKCCPPNDEGVKTACHMGGAGTGLRGEKRKAPPRSTRPQREKQLAQTEGRRLEAQETTATAPRQNAKYSWKGQCGFELQNNNQP